MPFNWRQGLQAGLAGLQQPEPDDERTLLTQLLQQGAPASPRQGLMPGETAGVPNQIWPEMFRILAGQRAQESMIPSAMPTSIRSETPEGEPLFRTEGLASPEEGYPALDRFFQRPHIRPMPSSVTDFPSLPEPTTVESTMIPNQFTQTHPTLSGMLEGALLGASSLERGAPMLTELLKYRTGIASQRAGMPVAQMDRDLGIVEKLDAIRRAQTAENRSAELFPYTLEDLQARAESNRALAEQRRREDSQASSIAAMRAELANLQSLDPAQLTDDQKQRIVGLQRGLASTTGTTTPYGTSPLGIRVAAREAELGRKLTLEEINAIDDASREDAPIYSAYQYIAGYNPDGSPIIKYGSPTGVVGKEVPKTLYGPTGVPSTGMAPGFSTSPPPAVPNTAQAELSGWSTSIKLIDDVMPQIATTQNALGPIRGRIENVQMSKLGGAGLTSEQVKLATNLRRLLTAEAFANGGKQLTITELEQYKQLLPSLNDTFGTAMTKAQQAREFLVTKMMERMRFLTPRQQMQLPENPVPQALGNPNEVSPTPSAPPSSNDPLGIR